MNVENNDWLDQRLAAKNSYVPDEGFAAQVMDRLPKKRLATAVQIRRRVLAISIVIACFLFVLQIGPLLHDIDPFIARYITSGFLDHAIARSQNPAVLFPIAGGIFLSGFAAIPFLRRWV